LTAYALGFLAEIPFMVLTFYQGPAAHAMSGTDISFAIGLIVAGSAFLVMGRSQRVVADATEDQIEVARHVLEEPFDIAPVDPEPLAAGETLGVDALKSKTSFDSGLS
jgi:hypothetical protein